MRDVLMVILAALPSPEENSYVTPTGINWLDYIVIPAAAIAALALIVKALLATTKLFRRVNHFLDDFFGEKEREGQPARPGVMARLAAVEEADNTLNEKFDTFSDDMRREVREERDKAFDQHVIRYHVHPEGNAT